MPGYWGIRIAAAAYIALCIYLGLQAFEFPAGGGKFPLFAITCAVLICGVMILQSFGRKASDSDNRLDFTITYSRAKPLLLLALSIAYVFLIFVFGYFITTMLFLIASSVMIGIRDAKIIAITAAILIPAMYGFFVVFLHAPLPKGILF